MFTATKITRLVDELAAHWTEPTLEILKGAGVRNIPVAMEVEAWRTLKVVLRRELRWQQSFRVSTLVSLSTLMEHVLREGALRVAERFEPGAVTYAFETRIRRLAGDRRATQPERQVYARIVRQPSLHAAFKPPTRTDFTPRLRVSAMGG
jgi:hypothetical protein